MLYQLSYFRLLFFYGYPCRPFFSVRPDPHPTKAFSFLLLRCIPDAREVPRAHRQGCKYPNCGPPEGRHPARPLPRNPFVSRAKRITALLRTPVIRLLRRYPPTNLERGSKFQSAKRITPLTRRFPSPPTGPLQKRFAENLRTTFVIGFYAGTDLQASLPRRRLKKPKPDGFTVFIKKNFFVGEDGFEPPKTYVSRFTVCPIWPLWYSP